MLRVGARTLSIRTQLFINGSFVNGVQNQTFETLNPSTGAPLATVSSATSEDVDLAVVAAHNALHSSSWGYASTPSQRSSLLRKLGALIAERKEEISLIDSLDEGKPLRESLSDVHDAVSACHYFASLIDSPTERLKACEGEPLENGSSGTFQTRVLTEPVGVVAAITPWNYPFLMSVSKVVPALAAGCSVVLKPSELAPLSSLLLADLCHVAGFPPGSINVLPGHGSTAGSSLASHPSISKVSFTGSLNTGRRVMSLAAANGPHPLTLELGGKSPLLLFPSCDLPSAIDWILTGILWGSGQVCSATSRVLAHRSLREPLLKLLAARLKDVKMRDSTSAEALRDVTSPSMGPVISRGQCDKIWAYIDGAADAGLRPFIGGTRDLVAHLPEGGFYVPPTVYVDVPRTSALWLDEIFGPILCITFFDDEEEAIKLANDSEYGLAASIFSSDVSLNDRVTRRLRVGVVWHNCSQTSFVSAPWGGVKKSGFGREMGRWGLAEFQVVKQVTGWVAP
jgi:betaine-aldehyde dehydrogenase